MPQLIGSICADKLMSSSIETSFTNFALGIIVSCDRFFEVWTLWVESGLGLPLCINSEELNYYMNGLKESYEKCF